LDRKLRIIPEPHPDTRTVFTGQVLPFMKSAGTLNLLCGNCNAKLFEGISEGLIKNVKNVVVKCPICQFFNEIPRIARASIIAHKEKFYHTICGLSLVQSLFSSFSLHWGQRCDFGRCCGFDSLVWMYKGY
jgi:hypothetical protein